MSWVAAGLAAAGAVKGGLDANHARKQAKEHDKFRRRSIELSPWSGLGDPGAANVGNTNFLSGAIGGGLQGAALGASFGGFQKPQTGGSAWAGLDPSYTQQPSQQFLGFGQSSRTLNA